MNLDKIKIDRLSEPEKFLLEIIDGLEEYTEDEYPEWVFYKTNDSLLFKYNSKNKALVYSYRNIRLTIINKFKYNSNNINLDDLVKSIFEQYCNLKVETVKFDLN